MNGVDERAYVRDLAKKIAEIAASPENELIKKRWRDVNALRKPDRAPVWCTPVGAWDEIMLEGDYKCSDPYLRTYERDFRRVFIKREMGDDTPVDSCWHVGVSFDVDPPNGWGVDTKHHNPNVQGGAWAFDPPLKTEADFDKLRMPAFTYNEKRTQEALSRAHDLVGDILTVEPICHGNSNATLVTEAAELRGLEQFMMDMAVQPELVHRLMAHLSDGVMSIIDQIEATGILTFNGAGPMFESDPIGEPTNGKLTCANLWCGGSNQETDLVSPAMWKEFVLDYQMPILKRFGLSWYGCCDDLTRKIDGVLTIPNLRIFVSSAWTDLDKVIEKCGTNYTIMWRQKASEVVFPPDTDGIAAHLDDGMRRLKGCYYQVILRELQTLAGHPDRLHQWTRLAIAASEKWA